MRWSITTTVRVQGTPWLGQSLPAASWPRAQAATAATAPAAACYSREEGPGSGSQGQREGG